MNSFHTDFELLEIRCPVARGGGELSGEVKCPNVVIGVII